VKKTWIWAAVAVALVVGTTSEARAAGPRVALETSKGRIVVELDQAAAPLSVSNFLAYVDNGFYAGTVFHRVIKGFMIQGGGFTADLEKKPVASPIQNEAKNGLANERGTIAMARTNQPHSATSQFYINTVDNKALDYPSADGWGYAVFGRVVEGMDVVDAIAGVATGVVKRMADVPLEPVVIESAKRLAD
jgi:cyclophilin family peptidyl-prolyl cis-trans isomerase